MRITVLDPNDTPHWMEVHRAGCADLTKGPRGRAKSVGAWTFDADSIEDAANEIASDFIAEGSMTLAEAISSIHWSPCVTLDSTTSTTTTTSSATRKESTTMTTRKPTTPADDALASETDSTIEVAAAPAKKAPAKSTARSAATTAKKATPAAVRAPAKKAAKVKSPVTKTGETASVVAIEAAAKARKATARTDGAWVTATNVAGFPIGAATPDALRDRVGAPVAGHTGYFVRYPYASYDLARKVGEVEGSDWLAVCRHGNAKGADALMGPDGVEKVAAARKSWCAECAAGPARPMPVEHRKPSAAEADRPEEVTKARRSRKATVKA